MMAVLIANKKVGARETAKNDDAEFLLQENVGY